MSRKPVRPRSPYDKASFRITPGLAQPLDPREITLAERTGRRAMYLFHPEQRSESLVSIHQRQQRKTLGTVIIACTAAMSLVLGIAGYEAIQAAQNEVRSRQDCQEFTFDQFATDPNAAAVAVAEAIHADSDSYRAIADDFYNGDSVRLCNAARYIAQDLITYRTFQDSVTTTALSPSSTLVHITPQS